MVSLPSGGGSPAFTMKMIVFALTILFLTPVMVSIYAPASMNGTTYEEQINALENEYYLSTGHNVAASTEVWALSGIYTPYDGTTYAYTPDGWLYGDRVQVYSNQQYTGQYEVTYNQADGLYYYSSIADDNPNRTYSVGDLYTAVNMDTAHKSSMFFTPGGKTDNGDGTYYYVYDGYRYAFSPLRAYTAEGNTDNVQVQPKSTSLSLIFYQYASIEGIAGQLSLSGSDSGLSYINASDIVKRFNAATYSSTFNMVFNQINMHLTIRMDADKLSAGMTPETAFNNGYWSVIVSSDAVASSGINDPSYNFNIDNIFDTLIAIFTFNLTDMYDIDGWLATLVSFMVSMPLYAALIAIALENYILLIMVAILGVIQAGAAWWPF